MAGGIPHTYWKRLGLVQLALLLMIQGNAFMSKKEIKFATQAPAPAACGVWAHVVHDISKSGPSFLFIGFEIQAFGTQELSLKPQARQ